MAKVKMPYRRPEIIEVGPAKALTLGHLGCTPDGPICEMWVQAKPF